MSELFYILIVAFTIEVNMVSIKYVTLEDKEFL